MHLKHLKSLTPQKLLRQPALLPEVFAGLSSETARVKYGCAKVLRRLSETQPELLYPHIDFFIGLLGHPNKILWWEGILVLGNLARVDTEHRLEAVFDQYFAPISGPVLITAANVIGGAAKIAQAKPHLADRVACELLKVQRARYQTAECRNVALGHAIKAFDQFFPLLTDHASVASFVKRQLKNSRPATRKKAEHFVSKHHL